MADIDNDLSAPVVRPSADSPPEARDSHTLLLQLAERTVLQAETLAKEIIDRAKEESEAAAKRLQEQTLAEAEERSRGIIDAAEQQLYRRSKSRSSANCGGG